jgi:hypothetical protein
MPRPVRRVELLAADMAIDGGATFGHYRRQLIKRECGSSRHNHL